LNSSFWKDRRVFVSGCDGFIGSWLTAGLVSAGADVIGLLRDKVPHSQLVRSGTVDQITVVVGDMTDYALLERTLAEYEIDTVFHLAAQTQVQIANRVPLSTFETNIKGTWVLMEAARRNPTVRRIVVASSDKAYGAQEALPYTEDSPLQGRHPYDVSKSCADLISQAYANTYDMPIVVTRFANLYGGGDLNWSRIVPGTIRSALQGNPPIIRSDGTFRRDYLFAGDAVGAYMLLAERMQEPEVSGQVFNFGLDQPIEAIMMVRMIIDLTGRPDLEPIILNQAQNEIPDQYLSSEKAHRILGWKPQHNIEEGLLKSIEWYQEYLAGE
jgi:CDP-glucose 4,6-dehydratase